MIYHFYKNNIFFTNTIKDDNQTESHLPLFIVAIYRKFEKNLSVNTEDSQRN